MSTLREFILDTIKIEEENFSERKSANKAYYDENGEIINIWWNRKATENEKKAIKHKVDLELKGMQLALDWANEPHLTLQEAHHFWMSMYEDSLLTEDIVDVHKWHNRIENNRFPSLANQAMIEQTAKDIEDSYKAMKLRTAKIKAAVPERR